jgi:hypothetical protein
MAKCKHTHEVGCPGEFNFRHCPDNTDEECNIIPTKRKYKEINGCAWIGIQGAIMATQGMSLFGVSVPCRIVISAADWAKLNGRKK